MRTRSISCEDYDGSQNTLNPYSPRHLLYSNAHSQECVCEGVVFSNTMFHYIYAGLRADRLRTDFILSSLDVVSHLAPPPSLSARDLYFPSGIANYKHRLCCSGES